MPNARRIPVCWKCNDEIEYDEIIGSAKSLKGVKFPGMDEVVEEYLNRRGNGMMEWLIRIFYRCL